MGVQLSTYTTLKYLADGEEKKKSNRSSAELDIVWDTLKHYNAFAFIIHDPNVHKEFHEYLRREFENLHYSSGDHFIFCELVDAPAKYCLTGSRPFYSDVHDVLEWFKEAQGDEKQYSYLAFALMNCLNLRPEMLPAVVITHDTRLCSYRWYKTGPDKLELQMARLTGVSNKMNVYKHNDSLSVDQKQHILYTLLDERDLDLCDASGTIVLDESMARVLSDIMSFLIDSDTYHDSRKGDHAIRHMSRMQKKAVLYKHKKKLQNLKIKIQYNQTNMERLDEHPLFPLIEELSIKLAICTALLEKGGPDPLHAMRMQPDWLEPHSIHFLETALNVEMFFRTRQSAPDYSISAICLAKMFEQEMNESFVHFLRKQQAIDLPRYYHKVQPEVKALITIGSSAVDLNQSKYGRWAAPELSKSKAIAKHHLTFHDWTVLGIHHPERLLTEWDNLQLLRNKASHTERLSLTELDSMKTSLQTLANHNIFQALSEWKVTLKSPAVRSDCVYEQ